MDVLPFADSDFVVGTVGRLVPVKGHGYMIEALAQLPDQVKLAVVGAGALRAALEEQVTQLGLSERVYFAGFREDIPNILQSLDCMCMPSLSEAMPFAILEAGAYARPIVATQVGGLTTLLKDGETALLVAPKDPTALASAIRRLLEEPDLRTQLGIASYTMVKQSFSAEEMVKNIMIVYERVT
jgi:glycosyltransferase involved in cell wall biosynthesis